METLIADPAASADTAELAVTMALQAGTILGLTGLIGKTLPDSWRDRLLPWVAMAIGCAVVVLPQYVDITLWMQGIALGGTVTGLYAVKQRNAAPRE